MTIGRRAASLKGELRGAHAAREASRFRLPSLPATRHRACALWIAALSLRRCVTVPGSTGHRRIELEDVVDGFEDVPDQEPVVR